MFMSGAHWNKVCWWGWWWLNNQRVVVSISVKPLHSRGALSLSGERTEAVLAALLSDQAARTVLRNFSTSVFKRPLSLDSERADASTCAEAEPVELAPLLT
jgi:hypothetical protein